MAVKFDFDSRFQAKTVQTLYQDHSFVASVADILQADYFEEKAHRWTAKTILGSFKKTGVPASQLVLSNEAAKAVGTGYIKPVEIKKFAGFISSLTKPVKDRSYIKEEVFNFCKEQALKSTILRSAEEYLPEKDYARIQKELLDIAAMDLHSDLGPGTFIGKTWEERQKRREQAAPNGITTGLRLDAYMGPGGLPPRAVGLILGPTGKGKTNLLVHFAIAAAMEAGVPVVYYSLELDEDMLSDRIDARLVMMPMRVLKTQGNLVREKWADLGEKLSNNLVVKAFPAGLCSMSMIAAHHRMLERMAFYPKLMVIDHIDLMKPSIVVDSAYENQGQGMLDFRGYMQQRHMAGWTASQGNRKSMEDDVDVDLQHTGDSIKKPQHADFSVGISQSKNEEKRGIARLGLLKNRFGPRGVEVPVKVDHEMCLWRDT